MTAKRDNEKWYFYLFRIISDHTLGANTPHPYFFQQLISGYEILIGNICSKFEKKRFIDMGHVSSKQPDVGKLRANVCPPIEEPKFDDLRMAFNSEMRRSFKITEDGFKRLMIEKHPLLDQKRIEKIVPALYKVYDQGMLFDLISSHTYLCQI